MNAFASGRGLVAAGVVAVGLLIGSTPSPASSARALTPAWAAVPLGTTSSASGVRASATSPRAPLRVPARLFSAALGLRSAPIAVPIVLEIPSIGLHVPVFGVGLTAKNVMDAPEGAAADPVWQEAFWYRGSAVPGAASTALIAGHIDDPLGRPGTFANIHLLRPGALIVVHDTRTGLDVRFVVTALASYPLDETTNANVLARMYGTGPVAGHGPQPSVDGRSHLTLVTCAGTFDHAIGTHDHRLAVYAVRIA